MMLGRPAHNFLTGERFKETVKLAEGETAQSRFDAWRAELTATPRFCRQHPRTQLVFDRPESGVWKVERPYDPWERPGYNPAITPEFVPGAFNFVASFKCPACQVARACCPPEFHETSFATFATDTPERASALARCREFVAQVNQHGCGMALFVGRPGTGKTRLACNIIREMETAGALYVRQGEITTALRATYGRKEVILRRSQGGSNPDDPDGNGGTPPSPLDVVQRVRFLVLDELGCTALANDERLLLDELLKHRYDERKPTILISNLRLNELKEFLGDALADRITHATGNGRFILQFSGESFRRGAGEDYLAGLGDRPNV